MEPTGDPIIDYLIRESKRFGWKEQAAEKREAEKLFGLHKSEWMKIKAVIVNSQDIVGNADTLDQAATRIKRDARFCSATWIEIPHIKLAIMMS